VISAPLSEAPCSLVTILEVIIEVESGEYDPETQQVCCFWAVYAGSQFSTMYFVSFIPFGLIWEDLTTIATRIVDRTPPFNWHLDLQDFTNPAVTGT